MPDRARGGDTTAAENSIDVATAWAVARPRVRAAVAARGAQPADADDVVQEVAVRALASDRQFRSEEHFVRWCCRVAINLRIDAVRRARRIAPPLDADAPGIADTARDAERRMALDRLATVINELAPEEQRLLFEATPTDSRRDAVRLAVRRHRLRARLAAMVDGLAGAFAFVRHVSRRTPASARLSVAAVPVVVVGMAIAPLLLPQGGAPPQVPKGPTRTVPVALEGAAAPSAGRPSPALEARRSNPAPNAAPLETRVIAVPPSPQSIVEIRGPAHAVVARQDRPEDHITVCTVGAVHVCVDSPRPAPLPTPSPPL